MGLVNQNAVGRSMSSGWLHDVTVIRPATTRVRLLIKNATYDLLELCTLKFFWNVHVQVEALNIKLASPIATKIFENIENLIHASMCPTSVDTYSKECVHSLLFKRRDKYVIVKQRSVNRIR